MDWSRAKTVLIFSFLLLNLLLGYQLWHGGSNYAESNADSVIQVEQINQAIAAKQIKIDVDIPKQAPKLKEITVKFNQKPNTKFGLEPPVEIRYILNSKGGFNAAFSSRIHKGGDSYEPDKAISKSGLYVFNQLYGGLPMFEVNLELTADKGGVVHSFSQSYVDIQPSGNQKEQKILSAYTAIGSLAGNYLPIGTEVIDIQLGYHGKLYDSETQVLAPYWRVTVKGGEVYYVHAITGSAEVPQKEKQ